MRSNLNDYDMYYMDMDSYPVLLHAGHIVVDIDFFNGALYWLKTDEPRGIAMTTNYESESDRNTTVTGVGLSNSRLRSMLIANIPPN